KIAEGMKKTAPDGAVSGMPAIRETGPGKNLQAITVSTFSPQYIEFARFVGRIRRSRRIRHKQRALCLQ
ncbi:hypothetical protein, partial [Escherichia coli]|nr:hypothetical protein [Escherichia coli]MDY9772608.1 hypothetical protein [Escherichia coli]MDY9805060.1 hypothetical protein [Escherichia coli]